jgi:hypothetical protein
MIRIYNKSSYVIDFTVGWSFGEQQGMAILSFHPKKRIPFPVVRLALKG